ncbi:4-hydroxy-tetrahydrodipicolinate synthase [Flectobacillus sp. DC10W]|jgi:4-hydroxy-tetrahydrodipicolinate synthase|uniref:4-hydroxy-tetrahydrodipicolinate synthase n=1 Tax=Flectobacillus longus TaxID=2984207 RepID=A0ABT6YS00_9BACT|nr:4-hydroxy-tetrahydrodipicolinate synthase [Flectobacillus longus]MDI9866354.1 4-hydroxy-tetrahydrodipicolinate synthase [Flectobacillus longus]
MRPKFHGVAPALVTPMHEDGSINYDGLKSLIQHVSDGGVDYLVVQGTTGESATTSKDEKKRVLEFVKEHNYKNLPIVYGVGGNNTPEVVKYLKEVDLTGVDAILSVCPYYNKPGARGVIAHYTAIADASPVPVIMYNIPGRTGINMAASTTLTLAQHPNIIGIKEASCIIEQCMEIYKGKPEDFLLISGDDVQAVPIIACGGVGVMSVIANAIPTKFTNMIHAALDGDFKGARDVLGDFLAIDPLLYEEGNPVGVKKILEIKGLAESHVRLPLVKASEELGERMKVVLANDNL